MTILPLAFGPYYRHPVVLKRTAPKPGGATYFRLTADHESRIAPYLLEDLTEIEQILVARGFAAPLRITPRDAEEITMFHSLFEHPAEATLAFVLVNAGQHIGVTRTTTFETRFADGIILYTSNSARVGRTPPRPIAQGIRFPEITDVAKLHDIHGARVRERAATIAPVPRTRGPDPLAYLDAEARETHQFWVARGYYRWTPDRRLEMTWRGAVLSAWRGLFPWKQLTERRNAREARAVLRRLAP